MAIYENSIMTKLLNYKEYLKEMSISDKDLENSFTFLKDIKNIKHNVNVLYNYIDNLKAILTNSNIGIKKEDDTDDKIYYKVRYPIDSYRIFEIFKTILFEITENIDNSADEDDVNKFEEIYSKCFSIIYPDNEEIDLNTDIEIEKINFNRIHIPVGLPKIVRGIGIGKKIYLAVIKKIKYISTNKFDRSLDSIFVWDSLRKDENIYSFVRNEQMICFDIKCEFKFISNILLEFFKYDIEDKKSDIDNNNYVLDTDFKKLYLKELKQTELKYLI